MTEQEFYLLLDELKLNLTIKRHQGGKFDARVYHPWVNQPVLSSIGKGSAQECLEELYTRGGTIENHRKNLEKVNLKRENFWVRKDGEEAAEERRSRWCDWG